MTALPAEGLCDPISVGLPGCPCAHCTCWERHKCSGMLKKKGGMTPEGLVDGVKAPPGLNALSHWVSHLTWAVRPSTDQSFIQSALRLQLLIKLPSDPLEFLNRSPFDSLLTQPAFFTLFWKGGQVSALSNGVFGELWSCVYVYRSHGLLTRLFQARFCCKCYSYFMFIFIKKFDNMWNLDRLDKKLIPGLRFINVILNKYNKTWGYWMDLTLWIHLSNIQYYSMIMLLLVCYLSEWTLILVAAILRDR